MEQQQISAKKLKAMEKVKRANAELVKVVREEKEQLMNFKEEGMSMKEKALKIIKKDGKISVQK